MAWTTAQRDALAEKIASGELTVRYGDKTVTYHSLSEMRSLLSDMDSALTSSSGTGRSSRAAFSRD